jgi:Beta-propeller repeat
MTGLSSITSAQVYPLLAAGYKAPAPSRDLAKVKESYAKIPLSFVANLGQADKNVKFVSRGSGYSLALAPNTFTLAVAAQRNKSNEGSTSVLQATLLGGNAAAKVSGFEQLLTTTNYFIGRDPRHWKTNVPNYAKVKYAGVYPGVDLVFYGNQNHLEYDFTVAPGVNPDVIALGFAGITDLRVDEKGDLILRTNAGEIRQTRPIVYQQVDGARRIIPASYLVKEKKQIAFQIADYDRSKPLVIDPTLAFSTFLGGNGNDRVNGIAVDAAGDIYLTGDTSSTNFPVTPGAFDTVKTNLDTDVFVTKMNAAGTALIYSTYFGGGGSMDSGRDIAIDAAGNAYISGASDSSDLPTTPGAFRSTPVGSDETDGFAMKLNATGTALVYSTFLGPIIAGSIAVDSAGNAFITGQANGDYPTTPGAFQTTSAGSSEAFVTKLNATGTALIYSTFLGGSGFDSASDIAIDAAGNAYVTGTAQAGFPVTPGAFQTTFGGVNDAFVTKLNATGTALIYSTFVGGSGNEGANGLTINEAGNAYLTGFTDSSNFPTTPGAFQTVKAAGEDVFVTEVNTSGSALVYSTYVGGDGIEFPTRIALDPAGNATLTGLTGSTDFPVTADAIQSAYAGNNDGFITRLNGAGTGLVFSTYLGGSSSEAGFSIAVDAAGNIIAGGQTSSSDFPTTPGAFQPAYSGGFSEAWVAKIVFTGFDVCFKDDGNGDSFQFDSSTGDYRFTHGDLTVTGTGTLSQRGCLLVLEDNQSGKRVLAQFNHCNNMGHAVVQVDSEKKKTTFVITDKNTSDNNCSPD